MLLQMKLSGQTLQLRPHRPLADHRAAKLWVPGQEQRQGPQQQVHPLFPNQSAQGDHVARLRRRLYCAQHL